jgi:hypothetical protein
MNALKYDSCETASREFNALMKDIHGSESFWDRQDSQQTDLRRPFHWVRTPAFLILRSRLKSNFKNCLTEKLFLGSEN